jgi:hypothetical protein
MPAVPLWHRFELKLNATQRHWNPLQESSLRATFHGPQGETRIVDGFWDGGQTWRVRFRPETTGTWHYRTESPDDGLVTEGTFECEAPHGDTPFLRHGPLKVSPDGRHLEHQDGTPFLWLGDTAWYGPALSTDEEWPRYLETRRWQGFNVVQWIATQWFCMRGDRQGRVAYTGTDRIAVDPPFFHNLDRKLDALNAAGFLGVPVMLWTTVYRAPHVDPHNPGMSLPEDQAALLARYMLARWDANFVAWILNGDGDYEAERAPRWARIGDAVFGPGTHQNPAMMHPCGTTWIPEDLYQKPWLDVMGYQSGHGGDADALRWLVQGPPSQDWRKSPPHPYINLETPYEDHAANTGGRHTADTVRRAIYWSLLVSPPAGVTYGGHGVWSWSDGSAHPFGHDGTGLPLPWHRAVELAGAGQIAHVRALFESIAWWRLQPAPEMVVDNPGQTDPALHIAAARSPEGDLALVYLPTEAPITLTGGSGLQAEWFNPRTGDRTPTDLPQEGGTIRVLPPTAGDWVLLLRATKPPFGVRQLAASFARTAEGCDGKAASPRPTGAFAAASAALPAA